jgi:hypothetical protein
MKNAVSVLRRRVTLVRIDVSEERIASIFKVKLFWEVGKESSNWGTLRLHS